MRYVFENADVYLNGQFSKKNIIVKDGSVCGIFDLDAHVAPEDGDVVYNFENCYIFPGFIDVHVHLREPGFSYKETIATATAAAAAGGYQFLGAMPNLNPVPDSMENLQIQLDLINENAKVDVVPYGAITKGEAGEMLSDMEQMSKCVLGFSDDGKGVQSEGLMEEAMLEAGRLGKIIAAHCEDNSLLHGGYIHDGEYCKKNNHKGICSASEYEPIKRDIELLKKNGGKYHVCHVSAKESVDAIREAKENGVDITCETAPHYLVLCDEDLKDEGRFKMNPPLRSRADRAALIEAVKDGTVDMIATDHAPHSAEEKSKGLCGSLMGVTGLETAFCVLYTNLVKKDIISLETLIGLMFENPKKRFGAGSEIKVGSEANFCIFDLNKKYTINSEKFLSMGKSSPFDGCEVFGKCVMNIHNGKIVYEDKER